ncbi:MAG: hypothetical protein AB1440_20665 [Pseudomonadota bacterium]
MVRGAYTERGNLKYEWADNPHLFISVTACVVVLALSFAAMFISLASIILRTDFYGSIDEQNLPWSERMGNRDSRLHAQFWSPRFQMARRTIAYGAIVFFGAFGAMALILIVFGHPS